ncbi:MAG: hypothetical protein IJU19_05980 [Bacteroidales bacterium]|nr:hypothetical protein [Bacteroidales bacterium]
MNRTFIRILLSAALLLGSVSTLCAQSSREWIRQNIRQQGQCRNVAITCYGGDLMLYGKNGYASKGCPQSLTQALHELNEDGSYIDDVQITEQGRWIILYGNNGIRWNDIPYSLERKLREYNDNDEVIYSVTFNDAGDWIVITKNYFSASDTDLQAWLKDGLDKGKLWSACLTDDACVAVYAEGYKVLGDIPPTLRRALKETRLDVYRLKIACTSWFFADIDGNYDYHM